MTTTRGEEGTSKREQLTDHEKGWRKQKEKVTCGSPPPTRSPGETGRAFLLFSFLLQGMMGIRHCSPARVRRDEGFGRGPRARAGL